jgi:hypothetical protein
MQFCITLHRVMQNCNIAGAATQQAHLECLVRQKAHLDYFGLTILMFLM